MNQNVLSSLIAANVTTLLTAIIFVAVPLMMVWTIKLYNSYMKRKKSVAIFKKMKNVEVVSFDEKGLPTFLRHDGEILSLEELSKRQKAAGR